MDNGLYLMQHSSSASARLPLSLHDCLPQTRYSNVLSAKASTLDMSTIWLFRLDHPSLNKILPLKNVLPSFSGVCKDVCIVFPLTKQKR